MTQIQKVSTDIKASAKPAITIQGLIDQSVRELGRALPSHMNPERMARIALTTLKTNPKLYECDPYTFLGALFQCAQLGLEPNIEGQAYIIPYWDNKQKKLVAQFQVGYKGYVELFWRHGSSVSLQMEIVCKNDQFSYDLGENKVHHVPAVFQDDRGEVVGYYAVAHLKNGGRAIKVMSKKEAVEFGHKFSKCFDQKAGEFYPGTPWREHFDAMAMKTVLKKLMKLLPKSIEIQKALAFDETVKRGIAVDMLEVRDEADHSPELPAPTENGSNGSNGTNGTNGNGTPEKPKVSALDVRIHELKAEVLKRPGGKDFYYTELGKLGAEHMTELSDLDKEVFKNLLADKLKERV